MSKENEIDKELTQSQIDRKSVDVSDSVIKFIDALIEKSSTQSELTKKTESVLLDRLQELDPDERMTDGALIELHKTLSKSKTDNANVIANLLKGITDSMLLQRDREKESKDNSGDITKDDITEVKQGLALIKDLKGFMDDAIKSEK